MMSRPLCGFSLGALALGAWLLAGARPAALGGDVVPPPPPPPAPGQPGPGYGTLGYGGPGLYPGFQGFGLGYFKGYGYGGSALGVGTQGGYPDYAGPGYPHAAPRLRRFCPDAPFLFYGGPGFPTACEPNLYGPTGPLVVETPVAVESEPGGDFGPFTGTLGYPESLFAPYAREAAATGATGGATNPPPTSPAPPASNPPQARRLGVDEEPVAEAGGARGMKVARVEAGSPAEKAGLRAGDVIRSINGYATAEPGNSAWIVANAAPDGVLKIALRASADGKERTVTARLADGPTPVDTSRPAPLPPVANGPPPATR